MNIARRNLVFGLSAATLAGCQAPSEPLPRPFPDPSFAQYGPILFDVNEIEVVSTYRSPGTMPYVESRFPVTPEQMLQRWARERLQATGGTLRRARFVIEDASMRENEIARQTGFRALFTTQQALLYEGSMRVTIDIFSAAGDRQEGRAGAIVTRSQSVAENATIPDRERVAGDLLAAMMETFNVEMERDIAAALRPFLR